MTKGAKLLTQSTEGCYDIETIPDQYDRGHDLQTYNSTWNELTLALSANYKECNKPLVQKGRYQNTVG